MWCVSQVRGGFTVSRQSTAASAVISGRPAAAAVGDEGSELARRHHKRRRRQNRSDQLAPSRRQHQQLLTADQEELTKEMLSIAEPKIQTNKTELITSQVRYKVVLHCCNHSTIKPIYKNHEKDFLNIDSGLYYVNGERRTFIL